MFSEPSRLRVGMLLLAAALALGSCGKKGMPLPPIRTVPTATTDLEFRQLGEVLELRLGYPKSTTAGEPLPGLESVEVWAMSRPVDDPEAVAAISAPEFETTAQRVLTLEAAELTSAIAGDEVVTRFPLTIDVDQTQLVAYGIRTRATSGEVSATSNLVQWIPTKPPDPPNELGLTPGAEGIVVTWTSAEEELEGFHIYRRFATSRSYAEPVRFVPAKRRRFLDESARFDQRYIYSVTGVVSQRPRIETGRSQEHEVHYKDEFAPPPPASLEALAQEGSVRLVWKPSPAADVAGYHVYRRIEDGESARLTKDPISALSWVDSGLSVDVRFTYAVTAVDRSGNEGRASMQVEATPR